MTPHASPLTSHGMPSNARIYGYTGKIVFDPSKPDGTMQKLMDVSLLNSRVWKATTSLEEGLRVAYRLFLEQ